MGFFKDFKQDLSQAVNELSDEVSGNTAEEALDDDVMVDTLSESLDDDMNAQTSEDMDVDKMLAELDANPAPEPAPKKTTRKKKQVAPATEAPVKAAPASFEIPEILPEPEPVPVQEPEPVQETYSMPVEPMEETTAPSDETTIITKGLKIKGDIESDGSIELLGSVDGNVSCTGKLTASGNINGNTYSSDFFSDNARINGDIVCNGTVKIGNGSIIIGNLTAQSAVIAGAIKGDIDVHGPVIVDSTAIVMGNIKSQFFQINRGACLEGYISQCYSDNSPKKFFG